jgi:hypothetical protein
MNMLQIETLLTFQDDTYIAAQRLHIWTTRSLSLDLEVARMGTG